MTCLRYAFVMASATAFMMSPAGAGSQPLVLQGSARDSRSEPDVPPNVPDRNGCVRLCEFDLNPCDTPIEKKLDGRCTQKD